MNLKKGGFSMAIIKKLQDKKPQDGSEDLKKHGKHLLLYILSGVGSVIFFGIGWAIFNSDARLSNVLLSVGIALGPVSLLGILYEWFLFDEIREGARIAFTDEISSYIDPVISKLDQQRERLVENTYVLAELHKLGIIKAYKERKDAFSVLREHMENEIEEIFLVGTSLRGLLHPHIGDQIFQNILQKKFAEIKNGKSNIRIRILLTHPAFAYLRQNLEKLYSRKEKFSIEQEIYEAVLQLMDLGAEPHNIQFIKGTPTCFSVKTSKAMLINPNPYQDQALGSFCLIISNDPSRNDIYRSFEKTHFIWDSPNNVSLDSFNFQGMEAVFHQTLQNLMPSPPHVQVNDDDLRRRTDTKNIGHNNANAVDAKSRAAD